MGMVNGTEGVSEGKKEKGMKEGELDYRCKITAEKSCIIVKRKKVSRNNWKYKAEQRLTLNLL